MSAETTETTRAKFHISLHVANIEKSVAFYRTFLGLEPVKHKNDYAKFELAEPPVVLSLIPGRTGTGGSLNHTGLRVPNAGALVAIQSRLEAAGIRTRREDGVECCHSRQTKFWVTDPDQTLWEIYVLHEEPDEEFHEPAPAAERPNAFANDSAPATRYTWQHTLRDGPITSAPHDNNSLHEILLDGSANLHPDRFNLMELLKDAHRALRPGGEVRIHGLTADTPLKNPSPSLPGPAAVVQHVPAHAAVSEILKLAGFVSIHFEQLSEQAHFTDDGVCMRESMIVGRKTGHRPQTKAHRAVYLGPLASVTDDFGNTFPRGMVALLNIHDWQALSHSSSKFLLLPPANLKRL